MSFRSKVENIWYHYKSFIIVGLVLLGVVVVSLHSCITKPTFDLQVYYVAEGSFYPEQLTWIENAVKKHCGDVNEDGEITVAVTGVRVGGAADSSLLTQYMTAVQTGDVMLFFGDQGGMEYLNQCGYIQPLTEFTDDTDGKGYVWPVSGSGFAAETDGFDKAFGEVSVYAALRVFDESWAAKTSNGKQNYTAACDTLRSILAVETKVQEEE